MRDLWVVQSRAPDRFNIRGIEGALGHSPMFRYQPINLNPAQIVLLILSQSNETAVFALRLGHGLRFCVPHNPPRPKEKWPFMVCVVMIVLPARATDEWRCTEPGTLILLGR